MPSSESREPANAWTNISHKPLTAFHQRFSRSGGDATEFVKHQVGHKKKGLEKQSAVRFAKSLMSRDTEIPLELNRAFSLRHKS